MKKIINLVILLIAQTCLGHIPQNGPLNLGDQAQTNQLTFARSFKRGIIMNTIMTNQSFAQDLANLYNFLNIPTTQTLPSYEEIVDALEISTNNVGVIAAIESFEKSIMNYLHYNHYIASTEGKYINIFMAGVKYNWFYPSEWINRNSWTSSYNSHEISQLIDELEQLANIASKHSLITYLRLKVKIESYRNWKKNTLIFAGIIGSISSGIYLKKRYL